MSFHVAYYDQTIEQMLGIVAWKTKKFYAHTMIYPWRCIATRGRVCLRTLVDRKAEAFHNVVDLVELSSRSTDRVPNVWHLRVLHTFSSVTSLAFLIQQDVEVVDEFRQHDGMVTVLVM